MNFLSQCQDIVAYLEEVKPDIATGLSITGYVLDAVGEVPGLGAVKIAATCVRKAATIMNPESFVSTLEKELDFIKSDLHLLQKQNEAIHNKLTEMFFLKGIKIIQQKYFSMAEAPNLTIWATEFQFNKDRFSENLADFKRNKVKKFMKEIYRTKCLTNFEPLFDLFDLLVETRSKYFLIILTFLDNHQGSSANDHLIQLVEYELRKYLEDITTIYDVALKTDPFFYAVKTLDKQKRLNLAYLPDIPSADENHQGKVSWDMLQRNIQVSKMNIKRKYDLYSTTSRDTEIYYAKLVHSKSGQEIYLKLLNKAIITGPFRESFDNDYSSLGYTDWENGIQIKLSKMLTDSRQFDIKLEIKSYSRKSKEWELNSFQIFHSKNHSWSDTYNISKGKENDHGKLNQRKESSGSATFDDSKSNDSDSDIIPKASQPSQLKTQTQRSVTKEEESKRQCCCFTRLFTCCFNKESQTKNEQPNEKTKKKINEQGVPKDETSLAIEDMPLNTLNFSSNSQSVNAAILSQLQHNLHEQRILESYQTQLNKQNRRENVEVTANLSNPYRQENPALLRKDLWYSKSEPIGDSSIDFSNTITSQPLQGPFTFMNGQVSEGFINERSEFQIQPTITNYSSITPEQFNEEFIPEQNMSFYPSQNFGNDRQPNCSNQEYQSNAIHLDSDSNDFSIPEVFDNNDESQVVKNNGIITVSEEMSNSHSHINYNSVLRSSKPVEAKMRRDLWHYTYYNNEENIHNDDISSADRSSSVSVTESSENDIPTEHRPSSSSDDKSLTESVAESSEGDVPSAEYRPSSLGHDKSLIVSMTDISENEIPTEYIASPVNYDNTYDDDMSSANRSLHVSVTEGSESNIPTEHTPPFEIDDKDSSDASSSPPTVLEGFESNIPTEYRHLSPSHDKSLNVSMTDISENDISTEYVASSLCDDKISSPNRTTHVTLTVQPDNQISVDSKSIFHQMSDFSGYTYDDAVAQRHEIDALQTDFQIGVQNSQGKHDSFEDECAGGWKLYQEIDI